MGMMVSLVIQFLYFFFAKTQSYHPLFSFPTCLFLLSILPQQTHLVTLSSIATTLLDPDLYPARDLCVLYHERWEIELAIDEIKDHQRLSSQPLRSKLPILVLQELYALLLAHYAVRALVLQAAETKGLDPDRVSFTEGLRVLKSGLNLSPFLIPAGTDRVLMRLHADLVHHHHLDKILLA